MYCHICLESYNTANRVPKNLQCGHTFCDRCLKKVGSGTEIECPKCRQKSKNNLPICYAIYDHLLLENKADLDEPCKIHEYEKLQFYCNQDRCNICALCLTSTHQGHFVSSIKDKIQADENELIINKWNKYFTYKKEEYAVKREKLYQIMKDFDLQKQKISKEINSNYDKLIECFNKSKVEMMKEIEEVYLQESNHLKEIKERINEAITNNKDTYLSNFDLVYQNLNTMSDQSVLSLNMEEYYNQDRELTQIIENIVHEKSKIIFKTIKWSEDAVFSRKEISLDSIVNEESKMRNHVVMFGDCKDKMIISFDVENRKWSKIESTFESDHEFLDYSCITQYKNDLLLITGGCVYSNYRNTASKNTFLVKMISDQLITFSDFKPMVSERFSHGSCVIKGVPYVFGGHNGQTTLSSIEYYDEKEGTWKMISNGMIMEREIFAHCVVKDRYIYVFGGFNDTHLDTIEKFDTVQNKWRMLNTKMKKPLQNATAVTIGDDQIALIGGYNGTMHKTIEILNLTNLSWTSIEKMRIPRRRSHCFKFEDKILIIGGEGTEVDQHIPELLDLSTMSMSFVEPFDLILSKSMNFWCSTIIL